MTDKVSEPSRNVEELRALVANEADNVATMLTPGHAGAFVRLIGDALQDYGRMTLLEAIPVDHKVAIRPIDANEAVVKFGARIGCASAAIPAGSHVHVQNVRSDRVPGGSR
jgi:hypothetical protein